MKEIIFLISLLRQAIQLWRYIKKEFDENEKKEAYAAINQAVRTKDSSRLEAISRDLMARSLHNGGEKS